MIAPGPAIKTAERYGMFARTASSLQSPFLLAVRLYWGWQFAQTGWGKLHGLAQVAQYFSTLHLPFPSFTAHFVAMVEFVGGILLIMGLLTRLTGLALSINMFVVIGLAITRRYCRSSAIPESSTSLTLTLFSSLL